MVFGTISDYPGARSARYRRVAREALEVADRVILVGPQSSHVDKLRRGQVGERLFTFETTYQATAFMAERCVPGELIYIKASLTDHLERIMLSQLDEVVCWRERCGKWPPCTSCANYRKAAPLPFGAVQMHAPQSSFG